MKRRDMLTAVATSVASVSVDFGVTSAKTIDTSEGTPILIVCELPPDINTEQERLIADRLCRLQEQHPELPPIIATASGLNLQAIYAPGDESVSETVREFPDIYFVDDRAISTRHLSVNLHEKDNWKFGVANVHIDVHADRDQQADRMKAVATGLREIADFLDGGHNRIKERTP